MTEPPEIRDYSATLLRVTPLLEVKLAGPEAEQGTISGHASVFAGQPGGEPDAYGDVIARSAFDRTIAAHRAAGTMPVMLWSHDQAHPIGRWLDMREDDRGLWVKGRLNLDSERGREAHAHLKGRDVGGLSIGFRLPEGGYRHQADGTRLLTEIDLAEISVCALAACRGARVTEIKSIGNRQELIDGLRSIGLPLKAAKAVAARGYVGLNTSDDDAAAAELAARIDAARRELKSLR